MRSALIPPSDLPPLATAAWLLCAGGMGIVFQASQGAAAWATTAGMAPDAWGGPAGRLASVGFWRAWAHAWALAPDAGWGVSIGLLVTLGAGALACWIQATAPGLDRG